MPSIPRQEVERLPICIACWECVAVCPKDGLSKIDFLGHRYVKISNGKVCIGCMKCVRTCPNKCFKAMYL